ncbi:MAG: flagellar protein FlgN [Chitinispirillaceae bacterium]|jgi:hypothetical protein|nr:flagellar protein FlgN [Chitinispirillaceae bacterium]
MNPTTAGFGELETILERETEAHEQMFNAAIQVNSAIKQKDLPAIQKQTASLDEHVVQIEKLEERRKECCASLSGGLGLNRESVRLATLIGKAPQACRDKLAQLQASLKSAVERIAKITVSNRILIEEGLLLVQGQFGIIMQSGSPFTNYRQYGNKAMSSLPCQSIINRTI